MNQWNCYTSVSEEFIGDKPVNYPKSFALDNTIFNSQNDDQSFVYFDGSYKKRITINNIDPLKEIDAGNVTISFWFNHDSPTSSYPMVLSSRSCSCYSGFYVGFACSTLTPMVQSGTNAFENYLV